VEVNEIRSKRKEGKERVSRATQLHAMRERVERSVDSETGIVKDMDLSAIQGTTTQVAEVVDLSPPTAELFDGSTIEITGRVVGENMRVGDLVLLIKVARWFILVGKVEGI